jgi:hypothetical protein
VELTVYDFACTQQLGFLFGACEHVSPSEPDGAIGLCSLFPSEYTGCKVTSFGYGSFGGCTVITVFP